MLDESVLFGNFTEYQPRVFTRNLFSRSIYLFKLNNKNTRKRCETCSKLTIKTPEPRQLQFPLKSSENLYFAPFSSNCIVNFEDIFVCWEVPFPSKEKTNLETKLRYLYCLFLTNFKGL